MSKQYPGGVISKTPVVPTSLSAPGIWTLNQQAAAQATNTWPFPRDPQFNYVTMLLHGDGSAGAVAMGSGAGTSSTVTNFNADASTNNFNVTINGDARSNNFTPYQEGYYSNYFDGTGDYLTAPSGASVSGTGAFTVEFWTYLTTSQSYSRPVSGGSNQFTIDLSSSGEINYGKAGVNNIISSNVGTVLNVWCHIVVARSSGGTARIWANGVSIGTATDSNNYTAGTVYIGSTSVPSFYLTGYLSNLRITNTDVYGTSNTTITVPTSPLTAVSGTSLLTCQSNRFIDNSASVYTITKAGDTAVSPAQPFTLPSSVATYGSGYFDGSGDYLTIADNAALELSTSSFTMEWWSYPTTFASNQFQLSKCATSASTEGFLTYINTSGVLKFNANSVSAWDIANDQGTIALKLNAWNHCAISRSGSSWRMWVNGVSSVTITSALGVQNTTTAYSIGGAANGSAPFLGYITDTRIVIGSYVYDPASSTITIPTTPLTAVTNTQLLTTQYNGGGNNSGFKDSSQFNFPITRAGNTTQGTFTPYGSNWSNYFGGSDYITLSSAPISATGAFTFECWVYVTGTATSQNIYGQYLGANAGRFGIFWNDVANKFTFSIAAGSYDSASTYTANAWYHIAWVRDSSNNLSLYVNGVRDFTTTGVSTSLYTGNPIIAARASGATPYTGYISNLRITNTAVYSGTSITVPTTPLTNISGTTLLTCQSNRFVDNSASPLTITVNGSPSVQRFSPFAPLTVYNPATNGGSGYFDGASDYLTAASAAALGLGSGDFTIELWVYLTANYDATGQGLITASYNTNFAVIGVNTGAGNRIDFYVANTVLNSGANYISLNAWTHLAFVRSSGTTKMYYNGVEKASSASLTGTGAAAAVYVGTLSHDIPRVMTGFMTDARIVKGTAVYTAAFTPNTAPLTAITNTSLLLNYTNAGILDNAMMNDLETVGNAQISTSVKKYGTGSMYFDGTGDNLTTASTPSVWLGGGAFTIEMWLYPNDASSQQMLLSGSDTGSIFLGMNIDGSNRIALGRKGVAVDNFVSYTYVTSAWIHLAITRDSSNNVRFFVNGTQVGSTGTNTNSFTNSALNIGFEPTQKYLNAYIDDLRISKVARYTANFTAPTTAFPNG